MDSFNLIEFSPPSEEKIQHLESPSNETNQSNHVAINVENSFKDSFIKIDSPSKFSYFNLNDEVFNTNLNLFPPGRESLLFDVSGKESLGILKLDTFNLPLPLNFDDLDITSGRESLGILKMDALNTNLTRTPNFEDFLLDITPRKESLAILRMDSLNTAFLHPSSALSPRFSGGSTNLSISITPSEFNSASLEGSELSKILTPSLVDFSFNYDFLNEAFLTSKQSFEDYKSKLFKEHRLRISSLPDMDKKFIDFDYLKVNSNVEEKLKCKSESEFVAVEKNILEVDEDDVFDNNLALIEAHHLTAKFEDGSILCDSLEENLLDSTAPPEFPDIDEEQPLSPVKGTTEVFKCIDKLIPVENEVEYEQTEELKENFVEILTDKLVNPPFKSINTSFKNPNEILQNLSVIINNENRDSKQNIEGQQLLLSLADMLCSGGSRTSNEDANSLEDSGHSSFVQDDQQICEEVKLKSCKSNEENIFESSLKEKTALKRFSQSFQFSTPFVPSKLFDGLKKKIYSAKSLDFDKDGSESVKLKPKKIEDRSLEKKKKGPLKALIPLGSMSKQSEVTAKRRSLVKTPSKSSSSIFKNKRTSTPIADPQIKPMAQSTPDGTKQLLISDKPVSCSSQLKKRKFICPVSPLAGPNSMTGNISGRSSCSTPNSTSNLSTGSKQTSMLRRHSAADIKCNNSNISKLKRTNSIGRNYKVQSEINRVKENLSSTLGKVSSLNSFIRRPSNNKFVLQERNVEYNMSKAKNVFNQFKGKSEKENIY